MTRVWWRMRAGGNHDRAASLRRGICAEGMINPVVDPGTAKDDHHSHYEAGTGFGSALFGAKNGFNELNCYLMLWNVAHLWIRGAGSHSIATGTGFAA